MWAHAVGHICEFEYFNKSKGEYDSGYWFKPEIVWDLYRKGMSLKQISKSMTKDITTLQAFKEQLINDNIAYKSSIEALFSKYLNI